MDELGDAIVLTIYATWGYDKIAQRDQRSAYAKALVHDNDDDDDEQEDQQDDYDDDEDNGDDDDRRRFPPLRAPVDV